MLAHLLGAFGLVEHAEEARGDLGHVRGLPGLGFKI